MFILGSALHYAYDASGGLWIVGVFAAMDESVWEHLKLAFWPGMLWTIILAIIGKAKVPNFAMARAAALALPSLIIVTGFYGYTALLGRNILVLDIGLFFLAIALGQVCAIFIYRIRQNGARLVNASWFLIAIMALAFSTVSYLPLESSIFVDHSLPAPT